MKNIIRNIIILVTIIFFTIGYSFSQCTTRIYLYDTYGDGWDGAVLDVFLDDVWLGGLECPAGNFGVYYEVVVPNGQTLSVAYTPGLFESEHRYGIDTNLDGTFEFADGYGPAYMGFTYSYSCGALDPCKVYVQVFDAASDGWQGGYLTCDFDNVQQGGDIYPEFRCWVHMFTVPSCAELSLTYTSGNWETENYYWVYRNGVYEFADLVEPTPGNSYNYTCSGVSSAFIFYSKSTGNLNDLSTWGSNANGTGCPPANFTTAGVTYNVHNNATPTTSGDWTVSGAGSLVKVGDNSAAITFLAGGNLSFDCDLEITGNATLNLNTRNMTLSGDLIRSASTAGFSQTPNDAPEGSTVTFSGSSQNINVTSNNGTTPTDSDITFNHIVISGSDVKLFYYKTNDRKLNINNFTVNSGKVVTLYSNPQ